ncbi:iron-containing alcohol dehydrogenase family protein [Sporolactobacillus terrae]|uniref:Glycerol dehydrogenase n=1 Tax=Sporolactobacillus terrae TaxID=269673 RepID=A0A410D721_9BACL|nr:iron-containing alcohol dehydrogenase family protein [Sporolactobacillus terrae]QAA21875.1 glycerol dehydrogenase [Sporolactobacillus terrae]QAA24848.1 glycerol dehydrogenase [Sporolactobacillus terrae]UAK16669.1 iron-containing alcohol dehydrogenase family protein [Sporolactobacillus terrae]BBN98150.1 glycerol dehydrogenase [Sporolactobacillus terrae]
MAVDNHQIVVPSLLDVRKGNLANLGRMLARHQFSKVVLFFGTGLIEMLGDKVLGSMKQAGIEVLEQKEVGDIDIDHVVDDAFQLPAQTEAVVGIGGGKALDAAKYTALLRKWPFISVPTSTSNDGFSSSNTSLTIHGRRISVHAKMPYGIVIDVDVIRNAPECFIYSGVGDLVSKITAAEDWIFEEKNGVTRVDDCALMLSKKAVNSFVRTDFGTIRDDLFIKELVDSLTMAGISMEIAGSSAPTSGSEHLISHALDTYGSKPQLHGIQVGVASYLMSKVQDHRYERITKVLQDTGFFTFAKSAGMTVADFDMAIDRAPEMKPMRCTYLHRAEYRDRAHHILHEDPILQDILL